MSEPIDLEDDFYELFTEGGEREDYADINCKTIIFPPSVTLLAHAKWHPVTHEALFNMDVNGLFSDSQPTNIYNQQHTSLCAYEKATVTINQKTLGGTNDSFKLQNANDFTLEHVFPTQRAGQNIRVVDDAHVHPNTGACIPVFNYGAVINPGTHQAEPYYLILQGGMPQPTVQRVGAAYFLKQNITPHTPNARYAFLGEAPKALEAAIKEQAPKLRVGVQDSPGIEGFYVLQAVKAHTPEQLAMTFAFQTLQEVTP